MVRVNCGRMDTAPNGLLVSLTVYLPSRPVRVTTPLLADALVTVSVVPVLSVRSALR